MARGKKIDVDTLSPEERNRVLKNREKVKKYRARNVEKIIAKRQENADRHKAWVEKNSAHLKAYKKGHYQTNRDEYRSKARSWHGANRDEALACAKARTASLSDSYVISLLARDRTLTREQVTPQLIELKRMQLQIHRSTKTLNQTLKEKE